MLKKQYCAQLALPEQSISPTAYLVINLCGEGFPWRAPPTIYGVALYIISVLTAEPDREFVVCHTTTSRYRIGMPNKIWHGSAFNGGWYRTTPVR